MKKPAKRATFHLPHSAKSFTTKKQLGQNFLADPNVKRKIIAACDLSEDDIVLEIGPGGGALTRELAPRVKKLIAIETDKTLAQELHTEFQGTSTEIIHADFLKYPVESLPDHLKIIGNLPYYISTPIIDKILLHPDKFSIFYLTIQYELGRRLAAGPGTKEFGVFSCFVQYYAEPKILFKIKNTAFRPIPKVDSCFLKLTPLKRSNKAQDEHWLFQIIRHAFQQRRKILTNALSGLIETEKLQEMLKELDLREKVRAENLKLEDFIALANRTTSRRSSLETNA